MHALSQLAFKTNPCHIPSSHFFGEQNHTQVSHWLHPFCRLPRMLWPRWSRSWAEWISC